ncbi:alpha/beta hydrolase [Candidatus Sneabacter namystus]|uniref:Alpha/beta fold hydrolase n=1 Tax=Candidatus Sneabacter namystus TaxID=2601646 RepID=A0A5C0UJ75_9RICK|nr:alpha/beta fold hydrolase [Candidatus Sneabacter namystus]QEK39563.1 alpha/beta fold hydrolase [Candidatus Sneabacter namystus]
MSELFFYGPVGRIEGRLYKASSNTEKVALVLHSHPLFGGSLNDPVVQTMKDALLENDYSVLAINSRGVGKSQGQFEDGVGELTDAAAALDWLENHHPSASNICVCGFSFGSFIAMQLTMRRPEVSHFISISPPITKYDFSFFPRFPITGLVVQGTMDSVTEEEEVRKFFDPIVSNEDSNVQYVTVENGDHFMRGKLPELKNLIFEHLKNLQIHTSIVRDKNSSDKHLHKILKS